MKFFTTLTIAVLLPFASQAEDQVKEDSLDNAALRKKIESLEAEITTHEEAFEEVTNRLKKVMPDGVSLEDLQKYLVDLNDNLKLQKDTVDELTYKAMSREREIVELRKEAKETEAYQKTVEARIGKALKLEAEISLVNVPAAIDELVAETAGQEIEIENLERKIKSYDEDFNAYERKLKDAIPNGMNLGRLKEYIEELNSDLDEQMKTIEEIDVQYKLLKQENAKLREKAKKE